ncbi:hypothetical protein CEXT_628401 [Caerostris extrusa]|uniref:Uncharacterized protein n=1 Tax=Caerostris extrusa TaxID=172846 RepID=A0AAV4M6G6_CAEEX|nr:hypothetical protein CEXT_628401 [Caerostris extrusa]
MKAALSLKLRSVFPASKKQSSFPLFAGCTSLLHVAIKVQLPQAKPVLEGRLLCQNNVLGTGASCQGQNEAGNRRSVGRILIAKSFRFVCCSTCWTTISAGNLIPHGIALVTLERAAKQCSFN